MLIGEVRRFVGSRDGGGGLRGGKQFRVMYGRMRWWATTMGQVVARAGRAGWQCGAGRSQGFVFAETARSGDEEIGGWERIQVGVSAFGHRRSAEGVKRVRQGGQCFEVGPGAVNYGPCW